MDEFALALEGLHDFDIRFRLQDVAQFLAGGFVAPPTNRPGAALHLLNIAGGPSPDSLTRCSCCAGPTRICSKAA